MSKTLKLQLMVLSVAFNVAFVTMWMAYGRSQGPQTPSSPETISPCQENSVICCPLHRELKIDQAQWTSLESGFNDFQDGCKMLCIDMEQLRLEIIDLLGAANVDQAALQSKLEAVLAGQRQMQGMVIKQLLAEKEVLTPQQQKQLFEMLRRNSGEQDLAKF